MHYLSQVYFNEDIKKGSGGYPEPFLISEITWSTSGDACYFNYYQFTGGA
jgi:hypothetical protein